MTQPMSNLSSQSNRRENLANSVIMFTVAVYNYPLKCNFKLISINILRGMN